MPLRAWLIKLPPGGLTLMVCCAELAQKLGNGEITGVTAFIAVMDKVLVIGQLTTLGVTITVYTTVLTVFGANEGEITVNER